MNVKHTYCQACVDGRKDIIIVFYKYGVLLVENVNTYVLSDVNNIKQHSSEISLSDEIFLFN